MDEFKLRAGEKFDALQSAAKAAANGGKNKVQDVASQTTELVRKIREAFHELWQHELIVESRERVAIWTRDALQRIRDGTPPLSPVLLYEELVALFKDRMWRRSVALFAAGAAIGGSAGLLLGLRAAARPPAGPHARALLAQPDRAVLLVDDAVTPGAGPGEVLIRVQAFSVCARDRAVLRGRAAALRSLAARSPFSIGRGFAGVVLDAGAGVQLELGDEVWGCVSEWSGGAASELLTVRSSRVSRRPRGLAADAAAALPWPGSLALAALDRAPYAPEAWKGKRVAIIGATSGEGLALLQLLSRKGARTATAAPKRHQSTLHEFGALEFIDMDSVDNGWNIVENAAKRSGPWDAVLCCEAAGVPCSPPPSTAALLKSTAPKSAFVDIRGAALLTDRLPSPIWLVFCASFYTYRALRWCLGLGSHADWLERPQQLSAGLERLAALVDSGHLTPALDKVYMPQDFEAALAHACSHDAVGTTVVRFPFEDGVGEWPQEILRRHNRTLFGQFEIVYWCLGLGSHADWLERPQQLSAGLERLAALVDSGHLTPALDKVYMPQDFEAALAHACSHDAVGTTVVRFPFEDGVGEWPQEIFRRHNRTVFGQFQIVYWCLGLGSHADWLERPQQLSAGLERLAALVDSGHLTPALDKWCLGLDADWLERPQQLSAGLERLAALVDSGHLTPALDKVYMPQDFEAALAHACSHDAVGTTVIRFP